LKKHLVNIREFFWPLLEKENVEGDGSATTFELIVSDESMDTAYDLKTKIVDNEEERRKSIETKATLFIGTLVIGSSLVLAGSSLVINQKANDNSFFIITYAGLSFILTIYTARTVWFAIKALERGCYSVLGIKDINVQGDKAQYQRHIIKCLLKITKDNQKAINKKVDNMTMAQEYYKRAIIMICVYSFTILLFCLFKR
jgi:hypothetical protein